ncbi:hypothetical protein llh_4760 [Lactococcus cremoris subsp. cremoris A76]|nr:hypothetical protein llh_4760 [Lactococcus cremoris subsp. cremoris A76]
MSCCKLIVIIFFLIRFLIQKSKIWSVTLYLLTELSVIIFY